MTTPLARVNVVELASIGPAPHAAMILADLGAQVTRICRPGSELAEETGERHTLRGRSRQYADLKDSNDRDRVLERIAEADVLIEGFRPGVAERLGLGPQECLALNPRLVYARMTGWGQEGPLAKTAGHDINFLALTGTLAHSGPAQRPIPPMNLVGDYGGGSMFLVTGILAALLDAAESGRGRVVDAAMVDGVSVLMQAIWEERSHGEWRDGREANLLDGGAPFYRTYRCADGEFIAVGALEPRFFALLVEGLGLTIDQLPSQYDRERWPQLTGMLKKVFASRTREQWVEVFEGTDACVTPVLHMHEVEHHPHMSHRKNISSDSGSASAVAAPRFVPTALPLPSES